MGMIVHHAIVVTADVENIDPIRSAAVGLGLTVTEAVPSPVNGYATFMVAPDGSSEGRETSNEHDELRASFRKILKGDFSRGTQWVEVSYGNDSLFCEANIVESNTTVGNCE